MSSGITQAPAQLNIRAVSDEPLTVTITLLDSDNDPLTGVSDPVVTMWRAGQPQASLAPTVTNTDTGVYTLAWTAAQMLSLGTFSGYSWSFEATLDGYGPGAILAGSLAAYPPNTPGTSSSSSASQVVVGTVTVQVAATVVGGGGGGSITIASPDGTLDVGGTSSAPTLDVVYGMDADTAAEGNDSRITGALQVDGSLTEGNLIEANSEGEATDSGVGALSVVSASSAGGIPAWAASTFYALNTLVTNGGNTYICNTTHTSGSTFSGESADWQAVGSAGLTLAEGGAWATSQAYTPGTELTYNGARVIVATAHTSGAFATDLAAGRVVITGIIANTTIVPTDGLIATYDGSTGTYKPRLSVPGIKSLLGYNPTYTRAHPPHGYSSGAFTQAMTRLRHIPLCPTNVVRLVYVNWANSTAMPTGTLTVQAALEDPYGGYLPATFNGLSQVTIAPGGVAISDPLVISDPGPTGAYPYYWSRTFVSVASGTWPTDTIGGQSTTAQSGDCYSYSNSVSNVVNGSGSFGTTGYSSACSYGPSAIISDTPSRHPVVFCFGDSITGGTGDTALSNGLIGYPARACGGAGIPFIQCGLPSEEAIGSFPYVGTQAHEFGGGLNFKTQWMSGCSHVIAQHGINDICTGIGSDTLSQFQTVEIGYWTQCANRGAKVYAPTMMPVTTSTDSWATTTNQTVNSNDSVRTGYNTWLRGGAPISGGVAVAVGTSGALVAGDYGHPLTGWFEAANVVESSLNSGKWKAPGYTTDGVHPSAGSGTATALLAAAVPTSSFTV